MKWFARTLIPLLVIAVLLLPSAGVLADDHGERSGHDGKDYEYEHHQGHESEFDDDDVEDDDEFDEDEETTAAVAASSFSLVPGENIIMLDGAAFINAADILKQLGDPVVGYRDGELLESFSGGHHLIFHAGKAIAYVDGQKIRLPAKPHDIRNQLFVPVQSFAALTGTIFYQDDSTGRIFWSRRDAQ